MFNQFQLLIIYVAVVLGKHLNFIQKKQLSKREVPKQQEKSCRHLDFMYFYQGFQSFA